MNTTPNQTKGTVAPASAAPKPHHVRFEFTFPDAGSVCLVGTFNEWHPAVSPMIELGQGRWAKDLMLPPGTYQYGVVVDGKWMADPLTQASLPGPSSLFSILRVPSPDTSSEIGVPKPTRRFSPNLARPNPASTPYEQTNEERSKHENRNKSEQEKQKQWSPARIEADSF